MNKIILSVKSNFGGQRVTSESDNKARDLSERVAKQILKELKLEKASTASGFLISGGDSVLLEIRAEEIARLLLGSTLFDSESDRMQAVDAASFKVLEDLKRPIADTKFGRALKRTLSSTERDIDVEIEVDGEVKSVCFSKNEPQLESKANEKGIFLIDSIFKTKAKCELICCKTRNELTATFDISGEVRSQLEARSKQSAYVELAGASIVVGDIRKKNSFVIKECLKFFDEKEYAEIRHSEDFHSYFSIDKRDSRPLNLTYG